MNRQDEQIREALAAEYVLGTLRGLARVRFERWLEVDADLQNRTHYWEESLQPLASRLNPVKPPSQVWQGIQARLGLGEKASPEAESLPSKGLRWWRGAGLSLAISALLAVDAAPEARFGTQ